MRLEAIEVKTLDGLNGPLEAGGFVPGVNVVLGPNASGKSSLVRALRAVLYPDDEDDRVDVKLGVVADDGTPLLAHRFGARTTWSRAGREAPPPRLPESHLVGAYVLQLEDLVGAREEAGKRGRETVDEHIAKRLQRELTGGVDLAALKDDHKDPSKGIGVLGKELQSAEAEVTRLRKELAQLRRQEEGLGADQAELEKCKRTAARGALVGHARDLADALERAVEARAALDALPPEVGSLQEGDAERVERLGEALRTSLDEVRAKRDELREAQQMSTGSRLPAGLTLAAAKEHVAIAEELCRIAEEADETAAELAEARAAVTETWRAMGGEDDHEGAERVDRDAIDAAAAAAFAVHTAAQERSDLTRRLAEVEVRLGGEEAPGQPQVKDLERAALELTRWLEVPPPTPSLPGWAWVVTFSLAVAAALAALLAPSPWPAVASGVVLGWLCVALLVSRRPLAEERDDGALRRSLAAAGLDAPSELTHEAAAELLAVAVEAASRAERLLEAREAALELATRLRSDLEDVEKRWHEAANVLAALKREHGFAATVYSEAGFVQWLDRVRDHAKALVRMRELESRREALEERRLLTCAKVLGHLVSVGADADPEAPAVVLRQRCQDVCEAVAARDDAVARAERHEKEIAAELARARGAARQLHEIAARLGFEVPGPVAEGDTDAWSPERLHGLQAHVRELTARRPEFESATESLRKARSQAEYCRKALDGDPELLAAAEAGDRAAIAAVEEAAAAAAKRGDELREAIGALKERIALATRERRLESALARAQRARDELEAHRWARMEAAAARFLVDHVEEEHEEVSKPAALERAKEWFGRVTHGDFELTFERGGSGAWRFGAEDRRSGANGRKLRLEELSTGTRAQLIVSARLAYAISLEEAGVEPVETLPFVLDEALTTSDPSRFAQVAGAVLDIVEASGRQFLYLSARPEDAELWRRAAASRPGVPLHVIDLAKAADMVAAD